MTHAIPRMDAEDITLSEIRQLQKDSYCVIVLIWSSWTSQTQRDFSRIEVTGVEGRGRNENDVIL
jgi:hypothetical protein